MEQEVTRITSFSINHDILLPGLYVSRVDGDVTTYDMRTRRPNTGDLMDNSTMHSLEHMFATYIRNGDLKDSIVYFGPMGCQTGFYLLVRNADHSEVLDVLRESLQRVIDHTGSPDADENSGARGAGVRRKQPRMRQLSQPEPRFGQDRGAALPLRARCAPGNV